MPYGNINVDTVTTSTQQGILGAGNASLLKNRLINGNMVIDQRNAGAAVTANGAYPVDRFYITNVTDGAYSAQQSTTAPAGFNKSTAITITSADTSLSATQRLMYRHVIEGNNISDLGWGTADAKTITLSFWVRSSLTGTFGGSLENSAEDRAYVFTYTISSANTWEQKTITIAGDTTGTWLTDNNIGIRIFWGLGVGSTFSGTAGSWGSTPYYSATGAVSVVGTSGATFYITGVQLEVGSSATGFEYRQYGQELALCQRYYAVIQGIVFTSLTQIPTLFFPVSLRTTGTIGTVTFSGGTGGVYSPIGTISCYQSTAHSAQQTATIPVSAEL
jgi:hypothetical protein